jgi:hypothetical protein
MRVLVLSCSIALLGSSTLSAEPAPLRVDDCRMDEVQESNFGVGRAIEGTCANNGRPIRCELNRDDSVSCSGPGGSFTGHHKETMIFSACGCAD